MSLRWIRVKPFLLPGVVFGTIGTDKFLETKTDPVTGDPIGTVEHEVALNAEFTIDKKPYRFSAQQAGVNLNGQHVYELVLEELIDQKHRWYFVAFLIQVMGRDGRPAPPQFINEYPLGADDGLPKFLTRRVAEEKNIQMTNFSRMQVAVVSIQEFTRFEDR